MTPKEKASEMVQKYLGRGPMSHKSAYECADMAVDEILQIFEYLYKPEYCQFDSGSIRKYTFRGEYEDSMTGYDMVSYWEEVRAEIKSICYECIRN